MGNGIPDRCGAFVRRFGGLTAPHSLFIIIVDTVVATVAVFFLQAAAISFYDIDPIALFFVREVIAIMLLFALYAGVRTLRAAAQGKLGHYPERGEFYAKENKAEEPEKR